MRKFIHSTTFATIIWLLFVIVTLVTGFTSTGTIFWLTKYDALFMVGVWCVLVVIFFLLEVFERYEK